MFTQSDMHPSNFGVDQHGKTVLLDFAEIGLLPETFVAYTMSSEKRLAPIAIALSLSASSNTSMGCNLLAFVDGGHPETRYGNLYPIWDFN